MRNAPDTQSVERHMQRYLAGLAAIAALLMVLVATSPSRMAATSRPQPSEVGVEAPTDAPFEIGTVNNSQSFR
jgi:hypothetical protein